MLFGSKQFLLDGFSNLDDIARLKWSLFQDVLLQVIDHYENPRNVGSLDKSSKRVGTGLVGAPACGDVMRLQVKVDDEGKIVEAKFKTFGCGEFILPLDHIVEHLILRFAMNDDKRKPYVVKMERAKNS